MKSGYRTLGRTGASVFERGFGAWAIGGNRSGWGYGPTDDKNSIGAIKAALDAGCNFFDTADSYGNGHSETLLGEALNSRRSDGIIATKVGFDFYHQIPVQNFHPAYLRFALHQSLRRLATDYVDLYQLHNPPPAVLFDADVIEALERLRAQGKVRWIGVSSATVEHAIEAIRADWPETIQVPYNMLAVEAERELFRLASARGVGVIAREPLANGFLSGKYGVQSRFLADDMRSQWPFEMVREIVDRVEAIKPYRREQETLAQLALRFVLESSSVSVAICGCKTESQVKENFAQTRTGAYRSPTVEA
jgi:aryl-alcohol dehydrogenase-like predicted oxidoreductase